MTHLFIRCAGKWQGGWHLPLTIAQGARECQSVSSGLVVFCRSALWATLLVQARALGEWISSGPVGEPSDRVERLYRKVYGRMPMPGEVADAVAFLSEDEAGGPGGLPRWAQLAQILLMSNEFMFVD